MRYQQRIHKAFSDLLEKESGNTAKEQYEKAIEQFPQLKGNISVDSFATGEVAALRKNNAEICAYFACDSDYSKQLAEQFPHALRRELSQTVRANVLAYRDIIEVLQHESDVEYLSIYKSLFNNYEKYFELAAEDILTSVYGAKYTDFAGKLTAEYAAKAKEAAAKRKAKAAAKAAEKEN